MNKYPPERRNMSKYAKKAKTQVKVILKDKK